MRSVFKKGLCLALALLMIVAAVPVGAMGPNGEQDMPSPDIQFQRVYFTDLGDTMGVQYAYPGTLEEVYIPESSDGKPVTTLLSQSLCAYGNLAEFDDMVCYFYDPVTVYLPASITKVEDNVVDCADTVTLVFQGPAPSFGENAFAGYSWFIIKYPAEDSPCCADSWAEAPKENYGGQNVIWTSYILNHEYRDGVCIACGEADPDYIVIIPGDVDGNGILNIIDIAKLYASVKGTIQLDEAALACADFNGDGQININDVAKAYAQVKG